MKPRFRADGEGQMMFSGVSERDGDVSFCSCCGLPMTRNSVLLGLSESRFAAIQVETVEKEFCRDVIASGKSCGLKEM